MKIKNSTSSRPHKAFVFRFILCFTLAWVVAFLWLPTNALAFSLKGNWSPPNAKMYFTATGDVNYAQYNTYGCQNEQTSCNGRVDSGGFSLNGYGLSAGSIGYHFYFFEAKDTAGNTQNIHGLGTLARAQITINYAVDIGSANVQFLGSTYCKNCNVNAPMYTPLGVENIHTTKVLQNDQYYPFEYSTTFDVVYVQTTNATNGIPAFLSDFYIGSSAQNGSVFVSVNNIVFYSDYDQYAADSSNTLTDIKGIVENIQNNSSNAGVIQQQQITNEKLDDINQQFEDARNEAETAQTQANTSGSQSATDASTDGQSLLQAFSSLVTAITGASPSNCNIDMNTGHINFGTVNLCSLTPPPAFQVISSIVVIGFAVPLSLACSRKIIELFRSFQT